MPVRPTGVARIEFCRLEAAYIIPVVSLYPVPAVREQCFELVENLYGRAGPRGMPRGLFRRHYRLATWPCGLPRRSAVMSASKQYGQR
ncbi:MAG: hypothetical protein QOG25_252 [Acetobacteraceae bacterium]|nr:hypothetical protein [Acetobacteraceae bacterium]